MKKKLLIVAACILTVLLGAAAVYALMVYLSFSGMDPKHYIGNSPDECSRMRFLCEPGKTEYFANEKGCGCVSVDQ